MRALVIAAALAFGCSDETKMSQDLSFYTKCGSPGDPGNSLGVGRFCTIDDFTSPDQCGGGRKAALCAALGGDLTEHFCTFMCHGDGGASECGENAECACQGGQCGCFPTACIH
jgi:hypothetical protein